ncbi:OadG family protein [Simiduia aestuariiviva]|uniref:Probable oxaloacetate decarboxylase gamma chain n=1 Tax=Simiduia aestuariiviva TaxID=1510459 RepID=A0A839URT6_9GAMM|nr:OadG family protein [Simiduia aestuariiviva]MBB3168586.1 oxaloacetate decarboxylase gamma subunit [Simiduia aestuariiviva]
MQQEIVQQGIDLMVFGMGTVVVFLTTLVIVTVAMSGVMSRFFPESEKPLTPSTPSGSAVDARTLAVIKAAIAKHRKR